MIVALPDEGVDLASLLSIQDLMPSLPSASGGILQKLHVELPAFSFSTSLDLVETLEAIGIRDAFSATADFSGLTDAPVFLTGARQDARITVDENGIEAAAFTELFGEAMAAPGQKEPDPIPFIVNRPFLFCVATEGIPLFVGVVLDPGA